MTVDQMIFGGGIAVLAVGLLIYLIKLYGGNTAVRIKAVAAKLQPREAMVMKAVQSAEPTAAQVLVKLHDMLDAEGKLAAAGRTVSRLANSLADEHESKMGSTFAPKDPTPPPAAS